MLVCLGDRAVFQLQVWQATTGRPCMAATVFSRLQWLRCLEFAKALSLCRSIHDHASSISRMWFAVKPRPSQQRQPRVCQIHQQSAALQR